MKTAFKFIILITIVNAGIWMTPQKASAQVSVSFQVFYDNLSPYGTWVDNPDYGYVWIPNVSPGFAPYGTNGHWVFTDAGWTWFSDYPWGWAPFHYGRWYSDPVYGPMWVPGNEWGPGWVTWRRSEGYYGWAPIEPGISISIAYSDGYHVPMDRWRFVHDRDFGRTNINNYYVNSSGNTTIINNSTVINNVRTENSSNTKYNTGPDRTEVQTRTGKKFAPVALRESSKPAQNLSNGKLQLYRPQVQSNNTGGQKPAPTKVASIKDVKPAAQRTVETQPRKQNTVNKEQPAIQKGSGQPKKDQPSQRSHIDQPAKQQPTLQQPGKGQPSQRQHSDQPAKQVPSQQQHNSQPNNAQPAQRQRGDQPAMQQAPPQQRNNQPNKEQPPQRQRSNQPAMQQAPTQQRNNQPNKEQPAQRQRSDQPVKQQPSQRLKQDGPPAEKQPLQRQSGDQPVRQQPNQQQVGHPDQPSQQQRNVQPGKEPQPSQQPDQSPNKDQERPH